MFDQIKLGQVTLVQGRLYVMLDYGMLCYVVLCYVMLCCVMFYSVMLCCIRFVLSESNQLIINDITYLYGTKKNKDEKNGNERNRNEERNEEHEQDMRKKHPIFVFFCFRVTVLILCHILQFYFPIFFLDISLLEYNLFFKISILIRPNISYFPLLVVVQCFPHPPKKKNFISQNIHNPFQHSFLVWSLESGRNTHCAKFEALSHSLKY